MTKHLGSCHCGSVRFEIGTDLPLGPYFRCNCSLCARKGAIMGGAPRSSLKVTHGNEFITTYSWNTHEAQHYFCSRCDIYTHHVMRGETVTVGVNMACIEGCDVFSLPGVTVGNGRDEWSLVQPGGAA